MKKLVFILSGVALAFSVALWSAAQSSNFKVIVHEDNPADTLSKKDVSNYLLKKATRWDENGFSAYVAPIDLDGKNPVREDFSKEVPRPLRLHHQELLAAADLRRPRGAAARGGQRRRGARLREEQSGRDRLRLRARPARRRQGGDAGQLSVGMSAESSKHRILAIVRDQPDDSSYDDVLRELAFERLVLRGVESLGERRLTTDEIRQRLKTWHA